MRRQGSSLVTTDEPWITRMLHSPCSRLNFSSGGTIIPAIRGSNPMQYSPVVLPNLRLFHLRQFSHAKSGNLFTFVQLFL